MIYGGFRACGKTTELIKLASAKFLYIVCPNRTRASYIYNMARNMKMDIPHPITVNELPLRGRMTEVLIDDVEDVLETLIQRPVLAMTTSRELKEAKIIKNYENDESWYSVIEEDNFYYGQIGKAVKKFPDGVVLEIVMRQFDGDTHKMFFQYEQVKMK